MKELIGKMDRRITIQEWTETTGTFGAPKNTWENWKTVWAKLEPVTLSSAVEKDISDRETAVEKLKFVIRKIDGVNEKRRIKYGNFYYDITSVDEYHSSDRLTRNNYLIITCEDRK